MRTILGNIIKANKIFKMIQDGDKVCVGVSGGKDSMTLLFALNLYCKKLRKEYGWKVEVIGIHLRMNLCAIEYDPIIQYWKDQELDFHVVDTKMGEILREKMHHDKIQCSLCSKMKKAILIENAIKWGCNKVAMGHHADDAIETLFMNMINEGRIATFKPKMYLDKTKMMFIRPLILAREKDIIKASRQSNIPVIPCGCPMEGFTQRDGMKMFLKYQIYDKPKTAAAYKNFFVSLMNGKNFDLWFKDEKNDKIMDLDLRDLGENDGKIF